MVTALTLYSGYRHLNPAKVCTFYSIKVFEKNEKETGVSPLLLSCHENRRRTLLSFVWGGGRQLRQKLFYSIDPSIGSKVLRSQPQPGNYEALKSSGNLRKIDVILSPLIEQKNYSTTPTTAQTRDVQASNPAPQFVNVSSATNFSQGSTKVPTITPTTKPKRTTTIQARTTTGQRSATSSKIRRTTTSRSLSTTTATANITTTMTREETATFKDTSTVTGVVTTSRSMANAETTLKDTSTVTGVVTTTTAKTTLESATAITASLVEATTASVNATMATLIDTTTTAIPTSEDTTTTSSMLRRHNFSLWAANITQFDLPKTDLDNDTFTQTNDANGVNKLKGDFNETNPIITSSNMTDNALRFLLKNGTWNDVDMSIVVVPPLANETDAEFATTADFSTTNRSVAEISTTTTGVSITTGAMLSTTTTAGQLLTSTTAKQLSTSTTSIQLSTSKTAGQLSTTTTAAIIASGLEISTTAEEILKITEMLKTSTAAKISMFMTAATSTTSTTINTALKISANTTAVTTRTAATVTTTPDILTNTVGAELSTTATVENISALKTVTATTSTANIFTTATAPTTTTPTAVAKPVSSTLSTIKPLADDGLLAELGIVSTSDQENTKLKPVPGSMWSATSKVLPINNSASFYTSSMIKPINTTLLISLKDLIQETYSDFSSETSKAGGTSPTEKSSTKTSPYLNDASLSNNRPLKGSSLIPTTPDDKSSSLNQEVGTLSMDTSSGTLSTGSSEQDETSADTPETYAQDLLNLINIETSTAAAADENDTNVLDKPPTDTSPRGALSTPTPLTTSPIPSVTSRSDVNLEETPPIYPLSPPRQSTSGKYPFPASNLFIFDNVSLAEHFTSILNNFKHTDSFKVIYLNDTKKSFSDLNDYMGNKIFNSQDVDVTNAAETVFKELVDDLNEGKSQTEVSFVQKFLKIFAEEFDNNFGGKFSKNKISEQEMKDSNEESFLNDILHIKIPIVDALLHVEKVSKSKSDAKRLDNIRAFVVNTRDQHHKTYFAVSVTRWFDYFQYFAICNRKLGQ